MILPFWKITILYFSRNRNDRNRTKQNDVCLHLTFGFAGRYDTHIYISIYIFHHLNRIAHDNYLFLLWSSQTILINQTMERNSFTLKFEIAHFSHCKYTYLYQLDKLFAKKYSNHTKTTKTMLGLCNKKNFLHIFGSRELCAWFSACTRLSSATLLKHFRQ